MKIEAVVFDWSGTISDDTEPVYYANMKISDEYGIPKLPFEEWKENVALSPREYFKERGVDEDPEKIFQLYTKYFSEAPVRPKLLPNVEEILSYLKLKNKTIAIISSHPEENLKSEIREYGLDSSISMIYGSVKDKVDALKKLGNMLNVQPSSILYVGDTIYDVISAREAGTLSAAVLTGYHSRNRLEKENPDLLINTLGELSQFIE